jgi:4-carboxymuconolactone decarboxylase
VKLSYPMLAMCVLSLAACNAASDGEPDAAPELVTPTPIEGFTPREVTAADIPQDIHEDSWARLPTLSRESLDAEDQRAFDIIVNPDSRYATGLRGPIGMWMYSPRMAEHLFPASTYLRYGADGKRDQRLTELAILTTARELDSQYEWTAHEPLARTAGLEEEIIELLRFGRPLSDAGSLPGLGERERTIIRVARELINEPKVSAETFVEAQTLFGNKGVMDLTGLVGYYTFVNYTLKTFDLQRTPGSQLLLPLP